MKTLTKEDMSNIVAQLSYELEPTGPLPDWNRVAMALIMEKNKVADAKAIIEKLLKNIALPSYNHPSREELRKTIDAAQTFIR